MPPLSFPAGTRDLLPLEFGLWQRLEERVHRLLARAGYAAVRLPLLEHAGTASLAGLVRDGRFELEDRQGHRLRLRGSLLPGLVLQLLNHNCHHQGLTRLRTSGPVCATSGGATQSEALAWLHSAPPSPAVVAEAVVLAATMAGDVAVRIELLAGGCPRCPRAEAAPGASAVAPGGPAPAGPAWLPQDPAAGVGVAAGGAIAGRLDLCAACGLFADELERLLRACGLGSQWARPGPGAPPFGWRLWREAGPAAAGRAERSGEVRQPPPREGAGPAPGAREAVGPNLLGWGWQLWRNPACDWLPAAGCMLSEVRLDPLVEEARRALEPPGPPPALQAYVAWTEAACFTPAFVLTQRLRQAGIAVAMSLSDRSLRSQLRQAARQSARFVLLLDREHLEAGRIQLREALSHWSESRRLDDLDGLRRRLENGRGRPG